MKLSLASLAALLLSFSGSQANQRLSLPAADVAKLEDDFRRAQAAAEKELGGVPKLLKSTEHLLEEAKGDLHLHARIVPSKTTRTREARLSGSSSAKKDLRKLREVEKLFGNVERLEHVVAHADLGEAEEARATASQEQEDETLRAILLAHSHHHRHHHGHVQRQRQQRDHGDHGDQRQRRHGEHGRALESQEKEETMKMEKTEEQEQVKAVPHLAASTSDASSSSQLFDAARLEIKLGKDGRKTLGKLKLASREVEDTLGAMHPDIAAHVEDLLGEAEDAQVKAARADFEEAKVSMAAVRGMRQHEQEAAALAKHKKKMEQELREKQQELQKLEKEQKEREELHHHQQQQQHLAELAKMHKNQEEEQRARVEEAATKAEGEEEAAEEAGEEEVEEDQAVEEEEDQSQQQQPQQQRRPSRVMLNSKQVANEEATEIVASVLPSSLLEDEARADVKLGSEGQKTMARLEEIAQEAQTALGRSSQNTRVQALLREAEDVQYHAAEGSFMEANRDLNALKEMKRSNQASEHLGLLSLKEEASQQASKVKAAELRLHGDEEKFFEYNHVLGEVKRAENHLRGAAANTVEGKELQSLLQRAESLADRVVVDQGKEWALASKYLKKLDPAASRREERRLENEMNGSA